MSFSERLNALGVGNVADTSVGQLLQLLYSVETARQLDAHESTMHMRSLLQRGPSLQAAAALQFYFPNAYERWHRLAPEASRRPDPYAVLCHLARLLPAQATDVERWRTYYKRYVEQTLLRPSLMDNYVAIGAWQAMDTDDTGGLPPHEWLIKQTFVEEMYGLGMFSRSLMYTCSGGELHHAVERFDTDFVHIIADYVDATTDMYDPAYEVVRAALFGGYYFEYAKQRAATMARFADETLTRLRNNQLAPQHAALNKAICDEQYVENADALIAIRNALLVGRVDLAEDWAYELCDRWGVSTEDEDMSIVQTLLKYGL
jgi:hypothetical protein